MTLAGVCLSPRLRMLRRQWARVVIPLVFRRRSSGTKLDNAPEVRQKRGSDICAAGICGRVIFMEDVGL
jgi:hypothetical protein